MLNSEGSNVVYHKAPDALCSNKNLSGCKDKKYLAHLQNISLKLRTHSHLFSYSTFHNSFLMFKDENDVSHYFLISGHKGMNNFRNHQILKNSIKILKKFIFVDIDLFLSTISRKFIDERLAINIR